MTDPVAGQDVEAQARALCEEAVKRIVYATVCRYEGHEPRCNVYGCTRHDHREVVAVRGYVWSALRAAQAEAERGKGAADAIESLEWALGAAERRAQEAEARELAAKADRDYWYTEARAAGQRGRAEGLREAADFIERKHREGDTGIVAEALLARAAAHP